MSIAWGKPKAPKVVKLNLKLIHRILAQYKRDDKRGGKYGA